MRDLNKCRLRATALTMGVAAAFAFQTAAPTSGVYSAAQASRGEALYVEHCASCHGARLENGAASPLTGARFLGKWNGRDADDLYYITRTQMPQGAGGKLSAQQYVDIIAYVLRVNGYPAGARDLPADAAVLKQIRIEARGPNKDNTSASAASTATGNSAVAPSADYPAQAELNAAQNNTSDWLTFNHDYSGQRYVDLKQINPQNVASLRPVCLYQAGDTKAFHTNPLVYRGVLYFTTSTSTIAIDAATCRLRWRHDWKAKSVEIHAPNRGVAIKDGRVVRATTDGYLFALDIVSGKPLWERKIVDSAKGEGSFNMAPLLFEDLVILGLGISEQGVRGWLGAFKAENGEPVWRFNTIPAKGEPGAETWGNSEAQFKTGGGVWSAIALDHERGLIYAPVANPAPDLHGASRPGANLYTNSMIVVEARTGKLRWHHQLVPHDTHDWDTTQASPLFTTNIGGRRRQLVAAASKDGLMHVFDRETKEHIWETAFTTRLNADVPVTTEGVRACPGVFGGAQWNGPAFNPRTNMLYIPAVDWCGVFRAAKEARHIPGQLFMGGTVTSDPTEKARGWLTAIDAASGKVAWKYESSKPMLAAVTTTASDLVFAGELTGDLLALDARSGKVLYRFHTGGPLNGGMATYSLNGKQYLAVASGSATGFWRVAPGSSTIIVFALP